MEEKPSNRSSKNPSKKRKSLAPNKADPKTESKKKRKNKKQRPSQTNDDNSNSDGRDQHNNANGEAPPASASAQLKFFLDQFQSANGVQLSSLELESIKDTSILELAQCTNQDAESLGKDVKVAFGTSWKEVLCGKKLLEGKIDPGSPAILLISASALRAIELLRGFRSLTKECHAVKLFSKHMKVEEQISLLKNRVNIASGTPSRIKKLIDIEALGLSRLAAIVLDIRPDVKGYSLLTLPQVRDEFWDLYKNYFHQRVVEGALRLGLYGPLPDGTELKGKKKSHDD
ncbi:Protein Cms [Trema orientale]|uniref:Protein Cms n=1 Tax=Trema orientale TaxID=63057 RepID=A0A2P5FCR3_TREOI|nr:Protein Cms [Trema orientale]